MNHKQKLGYIVLGAIIMLVGIGVGAIVSPPLIAQRDGVFGEIQCTRLTVVDNKGKNVVVLGSTPLPNSVLAKTAAGFPCLS